MGHRLSSGRVVDGARYRTRPVDETGPVANEEMVRYWNEEGGPTWVANERRYDVMLAPFHSALMEAAAPRPGEHVLDVGCGLGTTTVDLAAAVRPGGAVTALDVSAVMVDRTEARAAEAGLDNVTGLVADAQMASLPDSHFDLVVSRMGLMFFDDPQGAFAHLRDAMVPGGRLASVCWQPPPANPWAMIPLAAAMGELGPIALPPPGAPGPFALGDAEQVRAMLAGAGFDAVDVRPVVAPVVLGGGDGLEAAATHVLDSPILGRALAAAPEQRRAAALDAVRSALAAHQRDGRVELGAAAWLFTART
jgi:SAM-dependent methyltransferase